MAQASPWAQPPTYKGPSSSPTVVPPFLDAAMDTTPAIEIARTRSVGLVMPKVRKIKQVSNNVAMVYSRDGIAKTTDSPVKLSETVTKRKPTRPRRVTPPKWPCPARLPAPRRNTASTASNPRLPNNTTFHRHIILSSRHRPRTAPPCLWPHLYDRANNHRQGSQTRS